MSGLPRRCPETDWQFPTFNNGSRASADYRGVIAPKLGST